MALTPVRVVIGTTGASGTNNVAAMITAHNSALVTAVTAARAVTNVLADQVNISNTQLVTDADGITQVMISAVNYIVAT